MFWAERNSEGQGLRGQEGAGGEGRVGTLPVSLPQFPLVYVAPAMPDLNLKALAGCATAMCLTWAPSLSPSLWVTSVE